MIRLLFFLSLGLAANPFDVWLDGNADILKQDIKKVSFTISINSEFEESNLTDTLSGSIIAGPEKKFKYDVGPRVVVSDGQVWKSYDKRTDQIFIQKIDKKLEKKLFSWVSFNKIKALPVKKKKDGSFKLSVFSKHIDVRLHFSKGNTLDLLTIREGGIETRIRNIQILRADSLSLDIGSKSSAIFDLR